MEHTNAIQQLLEYMKICYLALLNFGNDLGYDTLKEHGCDVIPYLRKMWADLCKACLVDVSWYLNGYTPTLEEYLSNAWISISGPVVLVHGYFSMSLKSIQCYMHEADVSEPVAREHIRGLSDEGWKKMNKEYVVGNLFPRPFADVALECVYLKGDGFGHSDSEINGQVLSLVVEPIPIISNSVTEE
ncbi:Alpha-terpineol synthase, chloroplastic [Cinnamomum micranthum f. kanehirae]|uniref:Alpha-terpineol synthase, chloroplastic n=1 Tax=Cinnamomum micranthum f. kanehirae TaxID=337451 RepID=A0A3S3NHU0_9MAGN|nr:Alpha-terpineol synthase, chloroplastic [Cinnamomum micranthum f. kanehirae]